MNHISLRRVVIALSASALLTAAGALPGCGGGAARAGSDSADAVKRPTFDASDTVAATQLREKALTLLTKATASPDGEFRAIAIEALLSAPSRLKPLLPAALRDERSGVRSIAAMAVAKSKSVEWMPMLRPMLDDPSPIAKASAIYALTALGERVDPSPLAAMLQAPEIYVRGHAVFVLGEMRNPSAAAMLREAAATSLKVGATGPLRLLSLQFAEALYKVGDTRAISEIRAALYPASEQDLEAAAMAAQIIGQLGDRDSAYQLAVLTATWNNEKRYYPAEMRLSAAGALAKLGNPRGGFIADAYCESSETSHRAQAALVYGETRLAEHLGRLSIMIDDKEPAVRLAAAAAIAKIMQQR